MKKKRLGWSLQINFLKNGGFIFELCPHPVLFTAAILNCWYGEGMEFWFSEEWMYNNFLIKTKVINTETFVISYYYWYYWIYLNLNRSLEGLLSAVWQWTTVKLANSSNGNVTLTNDIATSADQKVTWATTVQKTCSALELQRYRKVRHDRDM